MHRPIHNLSAPVWSSNQKTHHQIVKQNKCYTSTMSTFGSKCNIEQLPMYLIFPEKDIREVDRHAKKA